MDRIKNIFLLLGLLVTFSTFAQADQEKIKASFDTIVYYPDSTIKGAYHLRKGLYNGYTIEYTESGRIIVGKYKKGKPNGVWLCSDPEYIEIYKKGISRDFYANWDFEGDRKRAERTFWELYREAINSGKTNKK